MQYWLLFFRPGATHDERLFVGMLGEDAGVRRSFISEKRLQALCHLVGAETAELAIELLRDWPQIWVNDHSNQVKKERLNYLTRYSNNLIGVTQAIQLDLPLNEKVWAGLADRFFDATDNDHTI